ncbi:hypothetical protein SEPCBS119000_004925 [Sporothrix epigloea]|uniref:Involucrin repeat protein n=1 Tax=Sporothrix epigloea TaxID=1892477 RepID=A0ABP0DUS1_9PEZI
MDSPRGSSPDPLSERDNDGTLTFTLPSAQRITRSQRSDSMYSLDVRNKMQPSRFSSPRKQTFRLAVGSDASPQNIRVTVETESGTPGRALTNFAKHNTDKGFDSGTRQRVNRRLFANSTSTPPSSSLLYANGTVNSSHRRQRSPLPTGNTVAAGSSRKRARLSTTTTKVPLRGLSDDDDDDGVAGNETTAAATPKAKRRRPRRSGTPKPVTTRAVDSSSPRHASPVISNMPPPPIQARRRPRAATPKAEELTDLEELASLETTPVMPGPNKRASGAGHASSGTPRAAQSTPARSRAKRVTKRTPNPTSRASARPAFSGSGTESVTSSLLSKRGRGRLRRQAMAPDEMAVIVENKLEEQQNQTAAASAAASASPDPIMDEGNDLIDAHAFYAPTPLSTRRLRATVSPAPTSLSSVDLISVQTPARPNPPTKVTSPTSNTDEEAVLQFLHNQADEQAKESTGDKFAYGAPTAMDYFGDVGMQDYGSPDTAVSFWKSAGAELTSPPGLVAAGTDDNELQTPRLPSFTKNTLAHVKDNIPEKPAETAPAEASALDQDHSEDDLAPTVTRSDAAESYSNRPLYSEDIHAKTPQVVRSRATASDAKAMSSTWAEPPTLAVANDPHKAAETSDTRAVLDSRRQETMRPGSPTSRRRDQSDLIHFSNVDSPLVQEAGQSFSGHHEPQLAQSELTAADRDSDDDTDVTHPESADDVDTESQPGSAVVMDGVTKTNFRDMDTIAKGEDFSMIGMESLQASFQVSHAPLPEMGEMTSRIVNRSLQYVRQGSQHGRHDNENSDKDGLSYLGFLYDSNSSTPAPASSNLPLTRSETNQTPNKATSGVATSSPQENDVVLQHLPAAKSDSPRKRTGPLREYIARKSIRDAREATAPSVLAADMPSPRLRYGTSSPPTELPQQKQAYDDSFSEIPDSVLEAVSLETTKTDAPFYSRQQAELTGQVMTGPAADESPNISEGPRQRSGVYINAATEHGENTLQTQQEAEITSSPPVFSASPKQAMPGQASKQRLHHSHGSRVTPVGFSSPRYPITSGSNDHLRVPPESFRPSLSPIVRAGRALQSVTSDPPTPRENEGYLRSPFHSSVARDTQSPAAGQGQDSSSLEPTPAVNESPIHDQLLREQEEMMEALTASADHAELVAALDNAVRGDVEQVAERSAEVLQEADNAFDEITRTQQLLPAAGTPSQPSQPSPLSISRAAWDMAKVPFSGIKQLIISGAQIISPSLRQPVESSRSAALGSHRSPVSDHAASPTLAPVSVAKSIQVTRDIQPSLQKRSASEAGLDIAHNTEPRDSSAELQPRSAKRLRVETSLRFHDPQSSAGSGNGERPWQSYPHRMDSFAGPVTSFATKLASRAPYHTNGNSTNSKEPSDNEIDDEDFDHHEADEEEAGSQAMMGEADSAAENEAIEIESDLEDDEEGMGADAAGLPEAARVTDSSRPSIPFLASEANSTQYGSDVILSMINDISGEGQDVDAVHNAEQDERGGLDMTQDDLVLNTPALPTSFRQREQGAEANEMSNFDNTDQEDEDEDEDIWFNEADRTQRDLAKEQPERTASRPVALASTTPMQGHGPTHAQGGSVRHPQDGARDRVAGAKDSRLPPLSTGKPQSATKRFLLDEFFSSPMVLPKQLPPTSEQNMRFNEESRRKAVGQYLEHERRREARDTAQTSPRAVASRSSSSALEAVNKERSPKQLPEQSTAVMSDREWEAMLARGRAMGNRRPALGDSRKLLDEDVIDIVVDGKYDNIEREVEEELLLVAAQRAEDKRRAERSRLERDRRQGEALEARRRETARKELERQAEHQREIEREREREREAALRLEAERESLRQKEIEREREHELEAERYTARQRETESRRKMEREAEKAEEEALRVRLAEQAEQAGLASRQHTPQAAARQLESADTSYDYANDTEDSGEEQEEASRSFLFADENTSHLDESSFLTPILKPLPAKTASPTKSCIRPMTKPKTPGRVVEFTSSTMTGGPDASMHGPENPSNAHLLFAEHFGLDTPIRVPSPSHTPATAREDNNDAAQIPSAGDRVHGWYSEEIPEGSAAMEQPRQQQRPYEVDQQVSDMMLSDTHEISAPPSYQQAPRHDVASASSGWPHFFPAQSIGHAQRQTPLATKQLPERDWQLDDWLLLNKVLQTYRREGALNFSLKHRPHQIRQQQTPQRLHNEAPAEDGERPASSLLNKVVHTRAIAMLVKSWHIDVVHVFMARSGHVWNEHYLMRRLFSLLMSEQRRGVFQC